jgi:cell division protein FtsI (penicillin-binding protein 3)
MVVLFALVGLRLVMVQVVGGDYWASYGEDQRIRPIELVAGRGAIFDRNGYDLAITVQQSTFVADPRLITDPAATAATLAPVLGLDAAQQAELQARLGRDASFVYVARQVTDDVAAEVDALLEDEELSGIWSIDEAKRFNPAGELARSLLGRVGVDNEGLSALELQYDENLSGEPGELIVEKDLEGRTIPAGRHHLDPAEPGEDLELTIDRNLQVAAEKVMIDAVRDKEALGGVAIISDPETGEILALVNIERDPAGEPVTSGNNTALTANYEPGSVNKVITLAAALEEGLVEPGTELMVPGSLQVADHTFTDDHQHLAEPMSVTDILTDSSNVGTIMMAQELGKERLYDYLRDFGFGRRTALDFPQEVAGSVPAPGDWSGTSIGTIPIGHGVAVTAMQMLYAYNAIANDGVYLPPKLVDNVIDADGERRPGPQGDPHRVVSATTAAQMRAMLANVVEAGTGEAAAIEGYQVAGKTGTARKPQEGGGYRGPDGRTHHVATFAGFMPADDPKLSVIVVLDEPRAVYASSTAAPAFAELARFALRLLHVPPPGDGAGGSPTITVEPPSVRGQAADPPPPPPTTTTAPLPTPAPAPADPTATAAALPPAGASGPPGQRPFAIRSPLALARARATAPGRRSG